MATQEQNELLQHTSVMYEFLERLANDEDAPIRLRGESISICEQFEQYIANCSQNRMVLILALDAKAAAACAASEGLSEGLWRWVEHARDLNTFKGAEVLYGPHVTFTRRGQELRKLAEEFISYGYLSKYPN